MARRKVEAPGAYTFNDWTPGTVLDAAYEGHEEIEMSFGVAKLHKFTTKEGKSEAVWGGTKLNVLLGEVDPGEHVVITFTGETPSRIEGHKPRREFELYVEDEPALMFQKSAA